MRQGRTPHQLLRAALLGGSGSSLSASTTVRAGGPMLPDDRLGVRTAPVLLLSRPDVRADLRLSPGQAEAAERELASNT